MPLALVSLFALGPAGCEEPPAMPPPDMPQSGPTLALTLGTIDAVATMQTGMPVWVDLSDGQSVQVAPGSQGGFHVWTMYRVAENTQARKLHVQRIADRIATDGTRQRVLSTDGVLDLPAQLPGEVWQTPSPIPSFMCPTPIGVSILDAPVELDVKLIEDQVSGVADSRVLGEAHVRLNLTCPPQGDPQHDFCISICKG